MTSARDPEFYLAHAGYVRALARRLVYDAHAADDLFQAAWLAALERPMPDASAPRRWLRALVRNLAIKTWLSGERRRARELGSPPPRSPMSAAEVLLHENERRRVVEALVGLDEPYRTALIQRFYEGLAPREIAARTGEPVDTVRTRIKRGLERLRERLCRSGALAVACVPALQAGPPGAGAVVQWVLRGVMLMSGAKKVAVVGVVVLALAAVVYERMPEAKGSGGEARPQPPAASASIAAPAAATDAVGPGDPSAASERLAVASATTGSLQVAMVWSDGSPAAGVSVQVACTRAQNMRTSARGAHSDAVGGVRFGALAPGEWYVFLDRGVQQRVAIRAGERTELRLSIPAGLNVRGRVLDLDGRPFAGADVLLGASPNVAPHVVARSDQDGVFGIRDLAADMPQALVACAKDRAPTHRRLVTGAVGTTVEIELAFATEGGAVFGCVTTTAGDPIAAATVVVGANDSSDWLRLRAPDGIAPPPRSVAASTDERGEYRIDGIAVGQTPVTIVADKLAPWHGEVAVAARQATRCDATLAPGARLHGVVRDERGAAVARANVHVGGAGIDSVWTQSGDDGTYALDSLPLGDFEAAAVREGSGQASTTLRGASGVELQWDPVLKRNLVLQGRIDAPGRELTHWRVSVRPMNRFVANYYRDAETDAQGAFAFTNCPEALLHVEARSPSSGNFVVAEADDVDAAAGALTLLADPAREPSAHLAGRVVDAAGRAIANADVMILPEPIEIGGHNVRSGGDGRFESPPCIAGPWRLIVKADGYAVCCTGARQLAQGAALDLGDLVLERGGNVAVAVAAAEGVDLREVRVAILGESTSLAIEPVADGAVAFTAIASGNYHLLAYGKGIALQTHVLSVRDGETTRTSLRVVMGIEVAVDIVDGDGKPVQHGVETRLGGEHGELLDTGTVMAFESRVRWTRRLAPGHYTLALWDHRGARLEVPMAIDERQAAPRQVVLK